MAKSEKVTKKSTYVDRHIYTVTTTSTTITPTITVRVVLPEIHALHSLSSRSIALNKVDFVKICNLIGYLTTPTTQLLMNNQLAQRSLDHQNYPHQNYPHQRNSTITITISTNQYLCIRDAIRIQNTQIQIQITHST